MPEKRAARFADLLDAQARVADYFDYHNHERLHSSIDKLTAYHLQQQQLQNNALSYPASRCSPGLSGFTCLPQNALFSSYGSGEGQMRVALTRVSFLLALFGRRLRNEFSQPGGKFFVKRLKIAALG